MSRQLEIYNLEFPPFIHELRIGDYVFKRVAAYEEAFGGLMHLVNSGGSESNTKVQTGSHQITAEVTIPDIENIAILPWATKMTQLDDILFLLTLFTGRNVFKKDWKSKDLAIMADHRCHQYGGQLILSLGHDWAFQNLHSLKRKPALEAGDRLMFDWVKVNLGFERDLNQVLGTISSPAWQTEYEGGYFLFLLRSAFQRQIIETSFILCWTIWEHIFAIKHRKTLTETEIQKMGGAEKITFILNQYFLKSIDSTALKNIKRINATRNRLIHFGIKTTHVSLDEMGMFIRLTEQLMAIILRLSPSNAFNSFENLDAFLKK